MAAKRRSPIAHPRLAATPKACAAVSAAILAALLAAPASAQTAAWFDKAWPVRRIVVVSAQRTVNAPGEEIAVVELPTDLLARADGSDLRVANAVGRLVPMRVLSVGPGSTARVAFAAAAGRSNYAIHFGNAKAPPPPADLRLDIQRGLLLETWTFAGGGIGTLAATQAALRRAQGGTLQGADFVPNVFLGHNLFGPSPRTISRYSGPIRLPVGGDYGFATSSDEAGFLLIDGELVVGWGGYHGWVGDARHNATVKLAAGLHRFEYLHANVGGEGGAVAAWKPPGANRWLPIPPEAFLPVYHGVLLGRERFGTPLAAEQTVEHAGEYLLGDDEYIQRYRFVSRPTGFDAQRAHFAWRFGDGLSAEGVGLATVEHVYLEDGPVEATVTVSDGGRSDSVTERLVVSRNWRHAASRKLEGSAGYVKLVADYDFAKMRPGAVARAMALFKRTRQAGGYLSAGHALAAQTATVDDRLLRERMGEYAKFLMQRDPQGGPAAAVNEYLAAAERAGSPFAKADMYDGAGRILLDRLNNDPKAEQAFAAALKFKDRGNDPAIKAAWIGTGDVFRRRGDGAQAQAAYEAAEKLSEQTGAARRAVEVGSLARSAEFYIRQGEFDEAREQLEQWDWQFPTHRLIGYSTLLWVRFYQAQKRHAEAIREASDLAAANPRSNYAAELLMLSADSELALGKPDEARRLLEHVAAVYPDSPLAADAKERLKKMGGS